MNYIFHKELNRMIDEYYKCDDLLLKDKLLIDIQLLTDALYLDETLVSV